MDRHQFPLYEQPFLMKNGLTTFIFFLSFVIFLEPIIAQNQDSFKNDILIRLNHLDSQQIIVMESLQKQQAFADSLRTIENKTLIQRLQEDLKDPYQGFKTFLLFGLFTLSAFLLRKFGPTWWQNFVRWIVENEEARLKSTKKILVLSSKIEQEEAPDNEHFIRGFFKSTGFNLDNIEYKKISAYEKFDFEEDLVFVNNEDGELEQAYLETYVVKKPNTVLFYFSPAKRWDFKHTKIANRMNSANFKAQIYGNLLSSLKYQDSELPKFSS